MPSLPNAQLTHVGLYVTDMEKMLAFYRRVLGLHLSDRGEMRVGDGTVELAFLTRDPKQHHQLVLASGRPPGLPFSVLNQLSFRLESLADLRIYHDALVADDEVSRIDPVTHGNAWSVYFRDPEDNRIELYADTPWHVQQPQGGPLDLTRSDEEIVGATRAFAYRSPTAEPVEGQRRRVAAALGVED